jgi:hypothetical protein
MVPLRTDGIFFLIIVNWPAVKRSPYSTVLYYCRVLSELQTVKKAHNLRKDHLKLVVQVLVVI